MPNQINPQNLVVMTNKLIDALTSEEFLSRLREVRSTPESDRLKKAASCLSALELSNVEPSIPSDIRISSRYFETTTPESPASLIKQIEKAAPDFLVQLKASQPDVYEKLASASEEKSTPSSSSRGNVTTLGVCAGGGVNGTCACAGQPLI
jgi:hypothetical protein